MIRSHQLSWFLQNALIIGFLKNYRQQSKGKLYFVGYLFSWFKWIMKSAKIRTPRLIMISQYCIHQTQNTFLYRDSASSLQVKVGEHTIDQDNENAYEKVYAVKKVIMHPGYDSNTLSNDVAILYLDGTVTLNTGVQPIALTNTPSVDWFNKDCTITGWGTLTESRLYYCFYHFMNIYSVSLILLPYRKKCEKGAVVYVIVW